MLHTPVQILTQLRASFKTPIGGTCALLVALACSTATGEKRTDVRTAFRDVVGDDSEPLPPSQPGPAPSEFDYRANQAGESLPTPAMTAPTHCHAHCTHCRPAPGYSRWPVVGPIHRRWITHTKPRLQASHWGYPEYFDERPFGAYVLQAEQMQVVNGLRDQQVLYNYDFGTGEHAAELKPRGQYQLRKIICRMEIAPCPIIVQTADANNPDPELDEARRQYVLEALRTAGVPAADEMVVVDRPPLPGLQAVEAGLIYGNLLDRQTGERGGEFDFDTYNETSGE